MVSAKFLKLDDYIFAYQISSGESTWLCALDNNRNFYCQSGCEYKELGIRAIIAQLMQSSLSGEVFAHKNLDFDFLPFGFEKSGEYYKAQISNLKLPHNCG